MKKVLRTLVVGIAAITILDIFGAVASKQLNFDYSLLATVSFVIYVAVAFFIARHKGKKTAVISTGLLGLFDATVGWKLSIMFGANTGDVVIEMTTTVLITTAILMTLFTSLLGLLGWWLSTKFK